MLYGTLLKLVLTTETGLCDVSLLDLRIFICILNICSSGDISTGMEVRQ